MRRESSALLAFIFDRPWMMVALIIVNLLGAVFGYDWYKEQLAVTPWYLWIFTPECPNQSLLFAVVLSLRLAGRSYNLLNALTFLGLIKYGAWTVLVLSYHELTGGSLSTLQWGLLISHVGMVIEGLVFLPLIYPAALLVLVPLWFGFNDFLDYVVGIHPTLPGPDQFNVALLFALLGTLFSAFYLVRLAARHRPEFN
ncbi:MAG: DUF1405 domain-containing protein [Candidatus Desulforudaceae bacterium]|nr:DUF1405 domain-containing protein [Bacillota bacterium]MBV1728453.1 DUF1405 domain-containing protein [Desulforudis sp.]MDP3050286.1 DUF1405 domain-containing protein [Eubacteriales bacterium]MDQ7788926.1 DUF1405 domain-containing protein [Clostridia bacterium]MBU4553721.1 DUF1405 domain-containing protein [Bacillota bacterium]